MTKSRITILKNTCILGSSSFISKGALFIFSIYLARQFTVKDFGIFNLALTFGLISFQLTDLGLVGIVKREISRKPKMTGIYLRNALFIRIVSSSLTVVILFLLANILKYSMTTILAISVMSLSYFMESFTKIFIAVYHGHEMMKYEAYISLLRDLLICIVGIILVLMGFQLFSIIILFVIASSLKFFVGLSIIIKKFTKVRVKWESNPGKYIIKEGYPLAFAAVFATIYFKIDILMLSLMQGQEEVGLYSAAYNILAGLILIPSAIVFSVYPRLAKTFIESKRRANNIFIKTLNIMLVAGLLVATLGSLFSKYIIEFVYGYKYEASIIPLQILFISSFFVFLSFTCGQTLSATNNQKVSMYVTFIAAILNIVLNFILIRKYSYLGASVATLVCYMFTSLTMLIYLKRNVFDFRSLQNDAFSAT